MTVLNFPNGYETRIVYSLFHHRYRRDVLIVVNVCLFVNWNRKLSEAKRRDENDNNNNNNNNKAKFICLIQQVQKKAKHSLIQLYLIYI
jgi:hypothetical protein